MTDIHALTLAALSVSLAPLATWALVDGSRPGGSSPFARRLVVVAWAALWIAALSTVLAGLLP